MAFAADAASPPVAVEPKRFLSAKGFDDPARVIVCAVASPEPRTIGAVHGGRDQAQARSLKGRSRRLQRTSVRCNQVTTPPLAASVRE